MRLRSSSILRRTTQRSLFPRLIPQATCICWGWRRGHLLPLEISALHSSAILLSSTKDRTFAVSFPSLHEPKINIFSQEALNIAGSMFWMIEDWCVGGAEFSTL